MSNFKPLERSMAVFLRRFPRLKVYVKLLFQTIMYLRYRSSFKFKPGKLHSIVSVSGTQENTFFGYFSQLVERGGAILYHRCSLDTSKAPKVYAESKATINVVCQINGQEHYKSTTRAFNWQQGAKLTWVSASGFVFNTLDENDRLIAKLVDYKTNSLQELREPVYEVINESSYIALGYEALTRLNPDYGYAQLENQNGLSYFAIMGFDNSSQIKLSIDDVNNQINVDGDSSEQCLNHASVSPDKSRVVLIHRSYPGGVRTDRLLLMNLNAVDKRFSIAVDSGMVSHYDWLSDSKLICYMRYDDVEGYFVIAFNDEVEITYVDIPDLKAYGDGHPARVSETSFISDTYPNKARMKSLLYVDLEKARVDVLAEFFESIKLSTEGRCDLHPRYDSDTGKIFVDSDHDGVRRLYALDLSEISH